MFEVIPYKNNNRLMSKNGDAFSQLFNNFFNDDLSVPSNSIDNAFKVDLKENGNEYIIQADLPGVKKEAINVEYNNKLSCSQIGALLESLSIGWMVIVTLAVSETAAQPKAAAMV